jgi:hypothetical protein
MARLVPMRPRLALAMANWRLAASMLRMQP